MSSPLLKQHRALIALAADTKQNASSSVKYRYMIRALEKRFQIIQKINAQPKQITKLILAALYFNPNTIVWRERVHKNNLGFLISSFNVNQKVKKKFGEIDFSLQIGCLFNLNWPKPHVPNFIYTDYTSRLSAQNPDAGRSPFSSGQLKKWVNLEEAAYQSAAHIFVRSEMVKHSLTSNYRIDEDRITIVGGGWNFSHAPPKVERSYSETINILFIGKRFYRKGGDILLGAFNKLNKAFPNTHLTIVTDEKLPEYREIEQVTVLKPIWDRHVIHQLYQNSHLFVLPSRLETWGDVLVEAMAYGIPCVGFNTDALPEIIQDEVSGCISNNMDADGLYLELWDLVREPQKIEKLGLAAREVSLSKFSWDVVVSKMAEVVNEKIHQRSGV